MEAIGASMEALQKLSAVQLMVVSGKYLLILSWKLVETGAASMQKVKGPSFMYVSFATSIKVAWKSSGNLKVSWKSIRPFMGVDLP